MLVTVGSITTAARAARIIEKNLNISVHVVHTPTDLNTGGCSYSIHFNDSYEQSVRKLVNSYKIPVRKWYKQTGPDQWRVQNDLS